MKNIIPTLSFLIFTFTLIGQPNCNYYKLQGDIKKYEACKTIQKAAGHYQFSKEYQEAFDEALAIDSTFAYAYRAKSTAYLKAGDFIVWKQLMDKAVLYEPRDNLDYRGWCRFQFFRDYEGAIEDILLLKKLQNDRIGFSVNGEYHLDIALALCYKMKGERDKAIQIIENKLADSTFLSGLYDHLHLGVLYMEKKEWNKALEQFEKQTHKNDLAENRFYAALVYKQLKDENNFRLNLEKASIYYQKKQRMFDPYTEHIDKIFWEDIQEADQAGFE